MKKMFSTLAVVLALAGTGAMAQSGAKDEAKKAGEATKEAAKDTGDAAKHAGKATAKATKKSAHAVEKAVTGPDHATCADGTVQAGETEAAAASGCTGHGGVKAKK